jgi:hypothetical protein
VKSFDDLIGGSEGLSPGEYERLRRVHDLLLEVPAPPEVPRSLRTPKVVALRRPQRRRWVPAAIAAALLAAAFAAGYFVAGDGGPEVVRSISMSGVGEGQGASATIDVFRDDAAGNYPMNVEVTGLEPNARSGDWYELWLTKEGKPIASCGRFTVTGGETHVNFSVPYGLRDYDGWIVTRRGSDEPLLTT